MFELEKTYRFEASHQLDDHNGKCKRLHGHSWRFTVRLRRDSVNVNGPKVGMVYDLELLGAAMRKLVVNVLDHQHINHVLPVYPTSENLAWWIAGQLAEDNPTIAKLLYSVTVAETDTSSATYYCRPE